MADRTQKLTLLAAIDERTMRRSIELTRGLEREVDSLTYSLDEEQEAADQLAQGLGKLNNANTRSIANIRARVQAMKHEQNAAAELLGVEDKLAKARERARGRTTTPQAATGGADLGRVERGVSSLGQVAGLVPGGGGDVFRALADLTGAADDIKPLVAEVTALARSGPIAAAALKAVGVSGGTAATGATAAAVGIGAITVAAGIFVVAFAAVAIAINKFTKDLEQQKAILDGAIGAQRRYYEIIQTGTSETIKAELEAAQVRQRAAQQLRADLQAQYAALSAIEKLSPPAAQLKKNIEELNTEVRIGAFEIGKLSEALDSNEVKARDAAAAQAEAASEVEQETKKVTVSRKAETAAITAQNTALQEATERRNAEMTDRRALITARIKLNEDLAKLEEKYGEERVKVNQDAIAKVAQINARLSEQLNELATEAARANESSRRELDAQVAQIQSEGAEREIALAAETKSRLEELEERHGRELERINRDFADAERDARLNRDAVALDAAQRQRDRATEDADQTLKDSVKQEKTALKERLKEQRRADEQRIRDLRAANIREMEERRIALEQRIADVQSAAQAEIAATIIQKEEVLRQLQDKFAQEKAVRQGMYQQEVQELLAHINQLVSINATGLAAIGELWQGFFSGLGAGLAGASASLGSSLGGSSGGQSSGIVTGAGGIPSVRLGSSLGFANGVRNFTGGLAVVGERGPELAHLARGTSVYSNSDSKQIMAGMKSVSVSQGAIVINTTSTDARGIMREVKRALPKMLTEVIEGLTQ